MAKTIRWPTSVGIYGLEAMLRRDGRAHGILELSLITNLAAGVQEGPLRPRRKCQAGRDAGDLGAAGANRSGVVVSVVDVALGPGATRIRMTRGPHRTRPPDRGCWKPAQSLAHRTPRPFFTRLEFGTCRAKAPLSNQFQPDEPVPARRAGVPVRLPGLPLACRASSSAISGCARTRRSSPPIPQS
jgi:hypothetical protein